MANRWGTMETVTDLILLGSRITADGDCSHEIKRHLLLGKKSYDQPSQHIKKQRHYFADKGPSSLSYDFSSSHVWMWELDHKECWALNNWCFWTVALENTLESPLGYKEIKPVNYKVNQPWIFIGRTDAETPVLWPLMWRALEKILMLGKIESSRRRGQQRMRWLDGITRSIDMSLSKLWETVTGVLKSIALQRARQELLSYWTEPRVGHPHMGE